MERKFHSNSNKKIKIIGIFNWPNEIYSSLFSSLPKDLFKITVYIGKKYQSKNIPLFYKALPQINISEHLTFLLKKIDLFNLPYIIKLRSSIKKEKPNIIISNLFYTPSTWQAYFYAKRQRIPLIIHTEIQRFPRSLIKRVVIKILLKFSKPLFQYASFIIPWTKEGEKFAKKYFKVSPKKIIVLPPGIDTILYSPLKNKKRNKDKLRILMVARMVPYKRYQDVLKAVEYLKEHEKLDFILAIRGNGPLEKEIKELIKEYQIEDKIEFLPRTPSEKMPELYAQHDILILPSYNEAIGMVVPEAMACGLPVIVSDTVGAKMYVKNDINGYIFKTFNYKDLAKKILLLSDEKKRRLFGKKAREQIVKNFSIEKIGEKYKKILERTLKYYEKI